MTRELQMSDTLKTFTQDLFTHFHVPSPWYMWHLAALTQEKKNQYQSHYVFVLNTGARLCLG